MGGIVNGASWERSRIPESLRVGSSPCLATFYLCDLGCDSWQLSLSSAIGWNTDSNKRKRTLSQCLTQQVNIVSCHCFGQTHVGGSFTGGTNESTLVVGGGSMSSEVCRPWLPVCVHTRSSVRELSPSSLGILPPLRNTASRHESSIHILSICCVSHGSQTRNAVTSSCFIWHDCESRG